MLKGVHFGSKFGGDIESTSRGEREMGIRKCTKKGGYVVILGFGRISFSLIRIEFFRFLRSD